jgi:hypothetical protein
LIGDARQQQLLPESEFRLYAVCSRFPHNLAQQVALEPVSPGVYQCRRGTDAIRVLVVGQLPQEEHNAPLHLFSAAPPVVAYGAKHFRQRSQDTSTLLRQLVMRYRGEGLTMPYTMEDFRRDYAREHFKDLTTQERLEAMRALPREARHEFLRGLSADERRELLHDLSADERRELLRAMPLEERLAGLTPEEVQELIRRFQSSPPSPPTQ